MPKNSQLSTWLATILAENLKIKNLPLIHKEIYKPIFCAGRFEPILLHVDFLQKKGKILKIAINYFTHIYDKFHCQVFQGKFFENFLYFFVPKVAKNQLD